MKTKLNTKIFKICMSLGLLNFFASTVMFAEDAYYSSENATDTTSETSNIIITLNDSTTTVDNESFSNNTGSSGGLAINNAAGDTMTIGDGSVFYNNTPTSGYSFFGGAINNNTNAIMTIGNDALFDSNQANLGGAAIYNSGDLEIGDDAEFTNNSAPGSTYLNGSGGAINNSTKGTLVIGDDVVFYNNKASGYGGAIFNQLSVTIGDNATFTDNSATYGGGAIYAYHASLAANIYLKIGDSATFTGNSATSSSGGAIFNYGVVEIGDYAEFTENTAYNYGGAVYNYGSVAKITIGDNATFTGNTASNYYGGAVYNASSASVTIGDNATFTDNSATHGGSVFVFSGSVTIGDNAVFAANAACNAGGAIYNNTGTLIIGDSTSTSTYNVSYIGNYVGTYNEDSKTILMTDADASDSAGGFLYQNSTATTEFNIDSKSSITIGDGTAGYDSIAGTGTINKTGTGTLTVNSSMQSYSGSLNVEAGTMAVNNVLGASSITIGTEDYTDATLALTVSQNNVLSYSGSDFSFTNYGTLKLSASASDILKSSSENEITYTLSANTNTDSIDYGDLDLYGGSLDGNTFTVSIATSADFSSATTNSATLNGSSSIVISDTDAGSSVVISSSSSKSTTETAITITSATEITNDVTASGDSSSIYTAISSEVQSDFTVLSSWDFEISFESTGDSVVVSFLIGEGLDLSTISLYHTDDDNVATDVTSSIISYEDGYLSFDADSFSSYTAIAVPEPSTYAMIFGALALGLAVYRRRK